MNPNLHQDDTFCSYCNCPTPMLKCCCGKYFCNNKIEKSTKSQVFYHLKTKQHFALELRSKCMKCQKCSHCFELNKGNNKLFNDEIIQYCKICKTKTNFIIKYWFKQIKCCCCEETNVFNLLYNGDTLNTPIKCRNCIKENPQLDYEIQSYSELMTSTGHFSYPGLNNHGCEIPKQRANEIEENYVLEDLVVELEKGNVNTVKNKYEDVEEYVKTFGGVDRYEKISSKVSKEVTLRRKTNNVELIKDTHQTKNQHNMTGRYFRNPFNGQHMLFNSAVDDSLDEIYYITFKIKTEFNFRVNSMVFFAFGGNYKMLHNETYESAYNEPHKYFDSAKSVILCSVQSKDDNTVRLLVTDFLYICSGRNRKYKFNKELFGQTKLFRVILPVFSTEIWADDCLTNFLNRPTCVHFYFELLGKERLTRSANPITYTRDDLVGCDYLSDSQKDAVLTALNEKISLVFGPPGTGKTEVAVRIVDNLIKVKNTTKILLCAASNAAVDALLDRLIDKKIGVVRLTRDLSKLTQTARDYSLHGAAKKYASDNEEDEMADKIDKLLRSFLDDDKKKSKIELEQEYNSNPTLQGAYKSLDAYIKFKESEYNAAVALSRGYGLGFQDGELKNLKGKNSLSREERDEINSYVNENLKDIAKQYTCVCLTLDSIGSYENLIDKYDYAIIDEASQALELQTLKALLKVRNAVFLGDFQQLTPTVRSQEAKLLGYDLTAFKRFIQQGNIAKTLLNTNYRMNPVISKFSSRTFYSDQLLNHPITDRIDPRIKNLLFNDQAPILFVVSQNKEYLGENARSYGNEEEKNTTAAILEKLHDVGVTDNEIGIISPYTTQRELLLEASTTIQIENVDKFQGNEKEVIIFSCARSNGIGGIGFLDDEHRLNVALTRSKSCLIVVGDPYTLGNYDVWSLFLEYCKSLNVIVSLNEDNEFESFNYEVKEVQDKLRFCEDYAKYIEKE
ncbi:hypothetical protein QTN25_000212 [Entamoeba marina]